MLEPALKITFVSSSTVWSMPAFAIGSVLSILTIFSCVLWTFPAKSFEAYLKCVVPSVVIGTELE